MTERIFIAPPFRNGQARVPLALPLVPAFVHGLQGRLQPFQGSIWHIYRRDCGQPRPGCARSCRVESRPSMLAISTMRPLKSSASFILLRYLTNVVESWRSVTMLAVTLSDLPSITKLLLVGEIRWSFRTRLAQERNYVEASGFSSPLLKRKRYKTYEYCLVCTVYIRHEGV